MDATANFCKVTVNQGYDASATSILVSPSDPNLSKLPNPATRQYNLTWWDSTNYPDPSDDPNAEIVRVTSKSSNTLTISRAQEGTIATVKNAAGATYKLSLGPTKKYFDDLDAISVDSGAETKYVTEPTSTGGVGAAGDGVTSDTTPIQDHITNGNYVVFPPGTYIISGEITLHSNLLVRGSGIGVTTVKFANSVGASSMFKGTSVSNVKFLDMTLDGNKANNASALDGVQLVTSSACIFQNCEFKSIKRHGLNLGATSCLVDGSRASSCDSSGVYIDGDNNTVTHCKITSNAVGITVNTGADDATIESCYFASNTAKVTNNGTNTHSKCNVGWKTCAYLQGTTHPAQTTGVVTESIAHGLDVTPTAVACNLSLSWENSADPTNFAAIRGPWFMSADGTNIKVGAQIATAGDTVNYRILAYVEVLP